MTMTKQTGSATKRTAEIKLYTCAIIFRWGKEKTKQDHGKLCKTVQNSGLAGLIFVSVFVFVYVFVNMCQRNVNIIHFPQINLLEYAIPPPPPLRQKNPDGDISGTKRGIRDPLVSKWPKMFTQSLPGYITFPKLCL